jgi:GT2 family glycosyltransferase
MEKKVTVIIPNYNGLKFMEPCFRALEAQSDKNFELLVVDNGSVDGSVEWLEKQGIPAVFLDKNTGFSGAVNVGISRAKTPYVILLNNDTEPEPDYVKELVRAIERSPKIFSVSSKMIQLYHKELMDDAGDMYSILGWAYQRGVGQSSRGYGKARTVFSACGGAAVYRREVFEKIGGFDEAHFAYLEDIDVGYRAKIYGYENLYCPDAVVYHVGSGTSGSKYNSFKVRLAARNSVYLNYKNMPFFQLLVNLIPILAGTFVKYLFFRKIGFASDYAEGLKEGLKTAKNTRKVKFQMAHAGNYLRIEGELIFGMFLYIWEFLRRKLKIFKSF